MRRKLIVRRQETLTSTRVDPALSHDGHEGRATCKCVRVVPTSSTELQNAIETLGLSRAPLCVHSSMRSFGQLLGGPAALVDTFLAEGCTLLVPSFSWAAFAIPPPASMRPLRNGIDYSRPFGARSGLRFAPSCADIDLDEMGAMPAHIVQRDDRVRGNHPLMSFAAIGPLASELVAGQAPGDAYAPLRALAARSGRILLIGVGLDRATVLHLAEHEAGRIQFVRWALNDRGDPMSVETGGCSEGFGAFEPVLASLSRETLVGTSRWRAFDAAAALEGATRAILAEPAITHCGNAACQRCNDAIAGGPVRATVS